ncbi:hypothetical protein [Brachybacterium sp. FME24]|uniref:hypothetical protein n=1 Tax=Brachybacterium sp. FME24 TaxID=2742605 RepID=UPI001868BECF|nr:hypothetical protein [Brachybacterium sp. FME24]
MASETGRKDSFFDGVQLPAAPPPRPSPVVSVNITTTVSSAFSHESPVSLRDRGKFLKPAKPYGRINSDLTLPDCHALYPMLMGPGNQFASAFEKRFESGNPGLQKYSFSRNRGEVSVRPQVHAYGDNVVIPTLGMKFSFECDDYDEVLERSASEVRSFFEWASKRLANVARMAFELNDPSGLKHLKFPRRHTMLEIDFGSSESEGSGARMTKFLSAQRRRIISSHIALAPDAVLDPRLERELVKSNAELNLKSEAHLLLLNAQGSLFLRVPSGKLAGSSAGARARPYENRFENVGHLSEIALLIQHLGLTASSSDELNSQNWASDSSAMRRWVKYPQNGLYRSVGNLKMWEVLSDSHHLVSVLDEASERLCAETI